MNPLTHEEQRADAFEHRAYAAETALYVLRVEAEAACHVSTCPCCDGEWECLPDCTFLVDCPREASDLGDARARLAPLRAALARLDDDSHDMMRPG